MLEVKKLMVFYENAIAVNNINIRCKQGEVTGVFGANSAGKSTLMYTISGIILDVKKKEEMAKRREDHRLWASASMASDWSTAIISNSFRISLRGLPAFAESHGL